MQCVTPMYRLYDRGDNKKSRILSREEALTMLNQDNNAHRKISGSQDYLSSRQIQKIPCQHCWACRLNYSAEWATRISLEAEKDDHCYFLTLTYDEQHIPTTTSGRYTLDPEETTEFIKALRKYFERKGIKGIKYFYAGEYGETTERPHYHFILMHCPLDINQFYDTHIDENWFEHWKSHEIERWWDKGIHDISPMTWSTAAYVARYCTKKMFDNTEQYENAGITPEFVRMSNGIGFKWYEKNKEKLYETDNLVMKTIRGNTGSYKPPKAFDRKYKEHVGPIKWASIKTKRQIAAERSEKLKQTKSDYNDKEQQLMELEKIVTKSKLLPRMIE